MPTLRRPWRGGTRRPSLCGCRQALDRRRSCTRGDQHSSERCTLPPPPPPPGEGKPRRPLPPSLGVQGGPGCSSLFGAFYELSPHLVDSDLGLQPNPGKPAALGVCRGLGAGQADTGGGSLNATHTQTLAACAHRDAPALFPAPCMPPAAQAPGPAAPPCCSSISPWGWASARRGATAAYPQTR